MSFDIKTGDLVWAKMKGFSPWPARVVDSAGTKRPAKKGHFWVYFFGSKDYGLVEEGSIKSYEEHKAKLSKSSNAAKFKKALIDIEEFASQLRDDPNAVLDMPETTETTESEGTPTENGSPTPRRKKEDENTEASTSQNSAGTAESVDENASDSSTRKRRSNAVSKKKATPAKRLNSESEPSTSTKRPRVSHVTNENGVSDLGNEILNLPTVLGRPESPRVDLGSFSELESKEIDPSPLTFGFLGLGVIGCRMVKNLIKSKHRVNLWSRNPARCEEIKEQANELGLDGVSINTYIAPCDVMQNSDIIFSCVADPRSAKENVIGNCGVVGQAADGDALEGKGYVEMTGIDPQTSKDLSEIIKSKGGRYLEAQIQGSRDEADEGNLIILTAGDESLFVDCQSCFKAMGKTSFYFGEVGNASKVYLILQLMKGISLVALAEGLALADRCGISSKDIKSIFNLTSLACPYLTHKAEMIQNREFTHVEQAIQHMQKDMKLALDLSDQLKQPLLMASTANEVYKHARRLGYDGHDVSCIYMRTRH